MLIPVRSSQFKRDVRKARAARQGPKQATGASGGSDRAGADGCTASRSSASGHLERTSRGAHRARLARDLLRQGWRVAFGAHRHPLGSLQGMRPHFGLPSRMKCGFCPPFPFATSNSCADYARGAASSLLTAFRSSITARISSSRIRSRCPTNASLRTSFATRATSAKLSPTAHSARSFHPRTSPTSSWATKRTNSSWSTTPAP